MNEHGQIYFDQKDLIPKEDEERLLKAIREEAERYRADLESLAREDTSGVGWPD